MAFGLISAGISAISSIGRGILGDDAAKHERRARRAQGKVQVIRNRQNRARFLQSFVLAQAAEASSNIGAGAGFDSSRFQGQQASTTTQARREITDSDQIELLGGEINRQLNKAGSARDTANLVGLAGQTARTFTDEIDNFFNG